MHFKKVKAAEIFYEKYNTGKSFGIVSFQKIARQSTSPRLVKISSTGDEASIEDIEIGVRETKAGVMALLFYQAAGGGLDQLNWTRVEN